MNNRSAAGLRRSAIVERIRLREEWSALKGSDDPTTSAHTKNVLAKKHVNVVKNKRNYNCASAQAIRKVRKGVTGKENMMQPPCDVLRGVVVLVEVGAASRGLALRAALMALGASVVPSWSPLVTHLVWSQGGCRSTRAKARALASKLVSPLWVEACAASARRLPEQAFPAVARASDLPSPRTLRQMLKKADMENIPIVGMFSEETDDKDPKPLRLRISSETEQDTSADKTTDTSRDTSHDKSANTSDDIESRVNTAPRRVLPTSLSTSPQPKKSRRKLFTQKEAEVTGETSEDSEAEGTKPRVQKPMSHKVSQRDRRDLARAERMARKIVASCAAAPPAHTLATATVPRIVLTGMNRHERQTVAAAVRSLEGRIQKTVTKRTTHVLLGSCREGDENPGCDVTGVTTQTLVPPSVPVSGGGSHRARTLNALVGAARGCRVLSAQWATDSAAERRWRHHAGYEVHHLRKISQKARVERAALGRQRAEYAYDVFNGMRVLVAPGADQRDAAMQLLILCGAIVQDGGPPQDGGRSAADVDVTIGTKEGQVNSKWVFDSVAAGRMRTVRRYVNCACAVANTAMSTQVSDR